MVKVFPPLKPDIPEPPAGQTWHVAPAGHSLWLEDYEYYDQMGRNPLQRAKIWSITSSNQRVEKLRELLKQYPKQKHRRNMLFDAAKRGDAELVSCLVQTGLKVHPDIPGVQEENEREGQENLESESVPDKDDPSATPVHVAAFQGRLSCVKIFMEEAKVEVDVRDEFGRTPLIAAFNHPEIVRYLLAQGADPTARTTAEDHLAMSHNMGFNCLEFSAGHKNSTVMRILLDHPSLKSTKAWLTIAAVKAAAKGGIECLKLLLERGEYPMKHDNGTANAILLSEEQRKAIIEATPVAAEQGDFESLKILLSYQFPSDESGNFAPFDVPEEWHDPFIRGLYQAMGTNQTEMFEFLNSLGLKEHETMSLDKLPEGQNVNVQHLLEKAVETGSLDGAKLVIEKYGAKPDQHRIPSGVRPLFIGAIHDKTEMLRYLLNNNHNIDMHFGNGRYATGPTALWGAIHLKTLDCITLLLQHGGPVDPIDEELRNIKGPTTAILRATSPAPGSKSRPMIFLETEENAREYVEWARHIWQNLNPRYVGLELDVEDKEWLNALQLRKENEELGETGVGARDLNEQEPTGDTDLSKEVRNLMPPMPTLLDREAELKNDDDLIPEFKPFMFAPSFLDRLEGNPEVC
ncbi:ankyrin repeat-containing domain protein [Xylaria sp. FL1042]|nr:ankyrin repeat-containing domain protein [Xylaria sp. FL1042]